MRTSWGKWIVAGRPMRAGYGMVKALAFVLLAGTLALQSLGSPLAQPIWMLGVAASWVAFVLCIVRGVPVVVEAFAADYTPRGKRSAGAGGTETGPTQVVHTEAPHGETPHAPSAHGDTGRGAQTRGEHLPGEGSLPPGARRESGLVEPSRIEKA
jgi:hypothetical protein